MSNKEKRRILLLLTGLVLLMLSLIIYLTYFMIFESETYRNSALNRRSALESSNTIRGNFLDREGQIIAQTNMNDEDKGRIYTYPNLYAHIIGYTYPKLGKSGLELTMNDYLQNKNNTGIVQAIKKYFEEEDIGNSVKLTINTNVQIDAFDKLGDNRGAIVAMNPKTGEIYSMISKPTFNPTNLEENWESVSTREDSPLFNRAINGLYPPGSVMKVISTAAILEENIDLSYEHTGKQLIDGYEYRDATESEYGLIGLDEAFTLSLNTYYVQKIQEVGRERLEKVSKAFMFDEKIPLELPVSKSTLNFSGDMTKNQISATAIGQGRVLATPLQMALMASAIANEGKIMEPHLVSQIINHEGEVIKTIEPKELSVAISPRISREIGELMVQTTKVGTGQNASIRNIDVASKTGTAENETGTSHAWYVGYAPAENPVVAVAVIVEQGGSGGRVAAPIGRDVIISVLNNISVLQ